MEAEVEGNIEVVAEAGDAFGDNVVVERPLADPGGQVVAHKAEHIRQLVGTDCIPAGPVEEEPVLRAEGEGGIDFLYFACVVVAANEDLLVPRTRSSQRVHSARPEV